MDNRQVRLMKVVLLVSSLATLLLLVGAAWQENFRGPWREYQRDYRVRLIDTATDDRARRTADSFRIEHKQLYLPELGAIDRCTTCHLGVENPQMADAPQPLTAHSGDLLARHPTEKFGCTVCHHGQGRAVDKHQAHGWDDDGLMVPHAEFPMLRGDSVYTVCGRCHAEIDLYGGEADLFAGSGTDGAGPGVGAPIDEAALTRTLAGAETVRRGKQMVVELGCLGCHKYRGRGGVLGPDITYVGDKTRHDFDFLHIKGEHTVDNWLFEHFKLPSEVSPDTLMPDLGLDDDAARDLANYMMSLHRKTGLASHTPRPPATNGDLTPVRGETLYKMYCSACHGADGSGTTMRAGLWPSDADPWGHEWDLRNIMIERRGEVDVMVPSLNHADTLAVASDEYLRHVIAEGRPGTKMLGWSGEGGLTDDEITLLVGAIRRWESPGAELSEVSSARGEIRMGAALYRANCAACHGSNGEGGIGVSLNSSTFLAVASDAFLRDTILHGRPNTAMPAWREFNGQEISDLLAFMRQWQPTLADVATAVAMCDGEDNDDVSVAIGRTFYRSKCVMCHGADGSGDLGPSLNTQAFLTVASNEYVLTTLIEGRPGTGMPSWRHLSNRDLASLTKFVRSWQTESSKPAAWHAERVPRGEPEAGRAAFAGACAGCHGSDAEGTTGPQLSNPVFLRTASDVMLREWISNGKPGTEMLGFRKGGQGVVEMSDRQIEDVVSYLRSLEYKTESEIGRVARSPHGRPQKGVHIYAANCAGCHGPRGEGASGPALSNPNFLRYASDGFLMATMALGRQGTEMRPVKRGPQSILGLTSDEVNDVIAYLRTWEYDSPFAGPDGREVPHRFVVPWDLGRGRRMFASYCAGCHGSEGRGSWAPELNNQGFLAAATDGFLQATIVRGRHSTAMRPFGDRNQGIADLTADDIDDIVAYIRHWSELAPSPMTLPAERSLEGTTARVGRGSSLSAGMARPKRENNTAMVDWPDTDRRAGRILARPARVEGGGAGPARSGTKTKLMSAAAVRPQGE